MGNDRCVLCDLLEEGTHEKSPKCLDGNLGDFGEFCKGLRPSEISDGLWFYQISDLILRFKPGCSESLNSGSLPIFSLAV